MNLGYPGKPYSYGDAHYIRTNCESLLALDPKDPGEIIPCLATSWKYSPDGTSITFNLREKVKFHDGTTFNAEAAKYCLDLVLKGSTTAALLKSVTSIDVLDDYTIRLNLSGYNASLLWNLSQYNTAMISPTALKKLGDDAMLNPVATGPFKFVSYQRDLSIKYERFDDYWGGKPYLDGIEWRLIADPVTALLSFTKGEAQVNRWLSCKDAADLQAKGHYNIVVKPQSIIGLVGDSAHSNSPFSNVKVRQAIAYALNNKDISDVDGFGYYSPTNQIAAPGSIFYNPEVKGYPYNPQKAKDLLAEAGYSNGFETAIVFPSDTPHPNAFTLMQDYLGAVGIKIKIQPVEAGQFFKNAADGWQNQLLYFGIPNTSMAGGDPGATIAQYISDQSIRYSPKSVYYPPDYNAKLAQANAERDPAKRKLLFGELQKMAVDEHCIIICNFVWTIVLGSNDTVHDLGLGYYDGWFPGKVWLSK